MVTVAGSARNAAPTSATARTTVATSERSPPFERACDHADSPITIGAVITRFWFLK